MNGYARARRAAQLKQEDVAKALGMERSSIAKWETGVAQPNAEKLRGMAKLYGCSIDDLFKSDEQKGESA